MLWTNLTTAANYFSAKGVLLLGEAQVGGRVKILAYTAIKNCWGVHKLPNKMVNVL